MFLIRSSWSAVQQDSIDSVCLVCHTCMIYLKKASSVFACTKMIVTFKISFSVFSCSLSIASSLAKIHQVNILIIFCVCWRHWGLLIELECTYLHCATVSYLDYLPGFSYTAVKPWYESSVRCYILSHVHVDVTRLPYIIQTTSTFSPYTMLADPKPSVIILNRVPDVTLHHVYIGLLEWFAPSQRTVPMLATVHSPLQPSCSNTIIT